jgi:hypothetical protein
LRDCAFPRDFPFGNVSPIALTPENFASFSAR